MQWKKKEQKQPEDLKLSMVVIPALRHRNGGRGHGQWFKGIWLLDLLG